MGAIPVAQLLLGAQLARISRHVDLRFVGTAAAMRLLGAPALGLVLSAAMGMGGLARCVSVVQAGMPTAINTVAISIEFGSDLQEVGGVVFVSTLASAVTLTGLLALLGG
jgi:predicted permease